MDKLFVKIVLLFKPLFARLQVDTVQLELLLRTKLLMDNRRPITSFGNRPTKESNHSSWLTLLLLLLMGGVLLFFLALVNKPFLSYTIYFGAFMAMLCLSLVADFSVILLDSRDNFIVLPRPVSDITFSVSRILHIGISVSRQVIGLAVPGFIYTLVVKGLLAGLIFSVQVFIASSLCVLLVNLFYLMAMKYFSARKFKDVVAYLQIVFSVVIFALYYTMPRIMESAFVQQLDFYHTPWLWFTPGAWIAALQEVAKGDFSLLAVVLSLIALVVPLVVIWLITGKLSKGFIGILAGMDTENVSGKDLVEKTGSSSLRAFFAKLLTKGPLENAGFHFVWMITGRTREFKTKVYPSMAYVPVYCFFILFMRGGKGLQGSGFEARLHQVLEQHSYLFVFYFSLLTLMTVFQFITQSEKYKAAWIYFVAPIQQPGQLMSGVLKAAFVKFYMPFVLVFSVLGLVFLGPSVLNDILLSTTVGGIAAMLICLFTVTGYPFSQPIKKTEGRFLANLVLIGLIGGVGFGHFLAVKYEGLVWSLVLVTALICWVMLRYFKKEYWEKAEFKE